MALTRRVPFYFVRHGVTDANLQDIVCGGDWDLPLHPDGVAQACEARATFGALIPSVERIVSSPMLRARQTARAINEGRDCPLFLEEGLREWRLGTWERARWCDVKPKMLAKQDPPGGESTTAFTRRIVNAIDRILAPGSTTLVVSHGAVAHVLFSALELGTTFIDNGQIYWIAPGTSGWTITAARSAAS